MALIHHVPLLFWEPWTCNTRRKKNSLVLQDFKHQTGSSFHLQSPYPCPLFCDCKTLQHLHNMFDAHYDKVYFIT